jgi:hypothetical protein
MEKQEEAMFVAVTYRIMDWLLAAYSWCSTNGVYIEVQKYTDPPDRGMSVIVVCDKLREANVHRWLVS